VFFSDDILTFREEWKSSDTPNNIELGLHNSGLLHSLSVRRLLVALELYEDREMCAELHMHFSVVLSILLFAMQSLYT
jgi:hypothetical protein